MQEKPTFSYFWILRDVGVKLNRSSEYKIIDEAPNKGITPLLEVVNEGNLPAFSTKLKSKYSEVWVDLPYYLSENENAYKDNINALIKKYNSNPENFFKNNKKHINVPVVSAKSIYPVPYSYTAEKDIYSAIKNDWDKIAVRIRVPYHVDYSTDSNLKTSFDILLNAMRTKDVLLLDVFGFNTVEKITCNNIEKMSKAAKGILS